MPIMSCMFFLAHLCPSLRVQDAALPVGLLSLSVCEVKDIQSLHQVKEEQKGEGVINLAPFNYAKMLKRLIFHCFSIPTRDTNGT